MNQELDGPRSARNFLLSLERPVAGMRQEAASSERCPSNLLNEARPQAQGESWAMGSLFSACFVPSREALVQVPQTKQAHGRRGSGDPKGRRSHKLASNLRSASNGRLPESAAVNLPAEQGVDAVSELLNLRHRNVVACTVSFKIGWLVCRCATSVSFRSGRFRACAKEFTSRDNIIPSS